MRRWRSISSPERTALCLASVFDGIMIRPLNNGTLGELRAALEMLRRRPETDGERFGVIGFCMGGSYALQLACVGGSVAAASAVYGQNPRPMDAFARACPIVASYPERDFTASGGRKLAGVLQRFAVPLEVKIYPATRHSFFNDQGFMFDAAAADDSWRRTLAFFAEHLARSAATPGA